MGLSIENPYECAGPSGVAMSPNYWYAWDCIAEDFKPAIEQMFLVLLSKLGERGLGWRGFTDDDAIKFYLKRIKQEIEEFEEKPSIKEAADVANFGMMLVYAMQKRTEERSE